MIYMQLGFVQSIKVHKLQVQEKELHIGSSKLYEKGHCEFTCICISSSTRMAHDYWVLAGRITRPVKLEQ